MAGEREAAVLQEQLDAAGMLREDHRKVKSLFEEFEQVHDAAGRGRIADTAFRELTVHSQLEEEIFYPAVREALGEKGEDKELMDEAEEEHHVVDLLMDELRSMAPDDDRFSAKFTVLAENVRHHIKEEESEMLPKASESGVDMHALCEQMLRRKEALMAEAEAGAGHNGHGRAANHRGRSSGTTRRRHARPASRGRSARRHGRRS